MDCRLTRRRRASALSVVVKDPGVIHADDPLRTYLNEMRPFPHPRSVEALTAYAQRHGAASGQLAAEPFMLLRESASAGMHGLRDGLFG